MELRRNNTLAETKSWRNVLLRRTIERQEEKKGADSSRIGQATYSYHFPADWKLDVCRLLMD
jgi:hypothetical protein